jgi:hypothetical protein
VSLARILRQVLLAIFWPWLAILPTTAVDLSQLTPPSGRLVDFSKDVQPIFESHCYRCHGTEKQKSGFRLDRKSDALRGGEQGVDIIPGNSIRSPLIHYVAGLVDDMRMPPPPSGVKSLSPDEVALLRAWIDQGAKWPAPLASEASASKADFWSFKTPGRPTVPQPLDTSWARNQVDLFILARLEKEGLSPAPETDKATLLRRVAFDLTGLPPTPEQMNQFVTDSSDDAYERVVERLLSSPRYGERWARYWLDTVHYGETHGYDKDKPRPNAWPYRDYVVRSFNEDKSYSRFVEEQLAGDVLFPDDPEGVVALGFLAAGPWDFVGHIELPESKKDGLITRYNDRDDMVMTTMSTFQSLTVHCARCHDHKFDPISQEDYYSLQATFAGVDRADRWFDSDPIIFQKRKQLLQEQKPLQARQRALKKRITGTSPETFRLIDHRLEELKKAVEALPKPSTKDDKDTSEKRTAFETEQSQLSNERQRLVDLLVDADTRHDLAQVESELSGIEQEIAALPPAQHVFAAAHEFEATGSFKPATQPRTVFVLRRGEVNQPLHVAVPGALSCLPGLESRFALARPDDEGGRRAALAKWITHPQNLLTRRSIVNRVWQDHFGRGIVDTPNDFGHMGSAPTHPKLLDWLAYWFQDHGESLKELHRLLVTSATYRQSSVGNPEFSRIDADNRYLWRMNRSRLDAEALHDAMLMISGRLDLTMSGPSVQQFYFKDDHSPVYDYSRFDPDTPQGQRRSLYRFIVRSVPDPFMEALDCPDASLLTPKRTVTVTALQALSVLNDPFVLLQAERLAQRLSQSCREPKNQIDQAYQLALGRLPQTAEASKLLAYAKAYGMTSLCRILLNSSEFMFVD